MVQSMGKEATNVGLPGYRYISLQEEYIKDEQRSLKRELVRAQEEIKRIQSVPLVIGQFMEAIDQKCVYYQPLLMILITPSIAPALYRAQPDQTMSFAFFPPLTGNY
jgi:ATP-dependent 26S proteasome regulatory subunit